MISQAIRPAITVVFPVPAPATIMLGSSGEIMAANCSALGLNPRTFVKSDVVISFMTTPAFLQVLLDTKFAPYTTCTFDLRSVLRIARLALLKLLGRFFDRVRSLNSRHGSRAKFAAPTPSLSYLFHQRVTELKQRP